MAIDTTPQPYTDAEMLLLVRAAIVQIMVTGQSYTIGTRSFTRASLTELRKLESDIQNRIDVSAGDSSVVLVQYGERV